MDLADEVKNIQGNKAIADKHATVIRVTEKYNSLVLRGLIKEEGRKVAMPGEINGYSVYIENR
ncbi:MAG: hypothetical protein LBS35_08460 [Synergistaceae bacterium]|jgi:hypothetical protein|nr:hypothetical protein [Synergistaceae bacterium]